MYEMIRPYVETDPSSFYTVSEFDAAYEMLVRFCEKRTQSIRKQLDGELATVTEQQDIAGRVDASDVEIAVMGVKKK